MLVVKVSEGEGPKDLSGNGNGEGVWLTSDVVEIGTLLKRFEPGKLCKVILYSMINNLVTRCKGN